MSEMNAIMKSWLSGLCKHIHMNGKVGAWLTELTYVCPHSDRTAHWCWMKMKHYYDIHYISVFSLHRPVFPLSRHFSPLKKTNYMLFCWWWQRVSWIYWQYIKKLWPHTQTSIPQHQYGICFKVKRACWSPVQEAPEGRKNSLARQLQPTIWQTEAKKIY